MVQLKMTHNGSYQLEHSKLALKRTHDASLCAGRYCTIHNLSDHHMRRFPQSWNEDFHHMERVCPHGNGHIDPDEFDPGEIPSRYACNGCCGCCDAPDYKPGQESNGYFRRKGNDVKAMKMQDGRLEDLFDFLFTEFYVKGGDGYSVSYDVFEGVLCVKSHNSSCTALDGEYLVIGPDPGEISVMDEHDFHKEYARA